MLELKHKSSIWPINPEKVAEEDFERYQIRKLVNDELRRYGLLITRTVAPKVPRWRTRANTYTLYGQVQGSALFKARPVICEGDFKECCIEAAKILDSMEPSA